MAELIKVRVKARTFTHSSKRTPYKRGDVLEVSPGLLATFMNELEAVEENVATSAYVTGSSSGRNKHKSK